MPQINLLPREYRQRRRARRTLSTAVGAGLVFVVFLGILYGVQRARVGREEESLRREQARTAQLRAQADRLAQFDQLQRDVEGRRGTLATALQADVSWSKFLNDLSLIMPDNSWLVNVQLGATPGQAPNGQPSFGTVSFQGLVFDFPGLAGWLTRIAQIDGLTFVYLTNGAKQLLGARQVVQFAANANVTTSLLSQRCQTGKPCL